MFELLKQRLDLCKKQRILNFIDKECDKCFELKRKLKARERFVNLLIDGYKNVYGEDLRKPHQRSDNK